jgi:hypothetical protein
MNQLCFIFLEPALIERVLNVANFIYIVIVSLILSRGDCRASPDGDGSQRRDYLEPRTTHRP